MNTTQTAILVILIAVSACGCMTQTPEQGQTLNSTPIPTFTPTFTPTVTPTVASTHTQRADIPTFLDAWSEVIPELYIVDVCDCSDMSIYMVEYLNQNGHDAYIIEGTSYASPEITVDNMIYPECVDSAYHAYVRVIDGNTTMYIEATQGYIIPSELMVYYDRNVTYDGLSGYWYDNVLAGYELNSIADDFGGIETIHIALYNAGWDNLPEFDVLDEIELALSTA